MELEYKEAREYIILHGKDLLERDKSGKGYVCPCCGSGSGRHGTGMREDRERPGYFKCWAGAGTGDCPDHDNIITTIQKAHHLSPHEAFKECCERFSIEVVKERPLNAPVPSAVAEIEKLKAAHKKEAEQRKPSITPEEIAEEIRAARKNLHKTDYLTKRGLSMATQEAFGCGFLENWYNPDVREGIVSGKWNFKGTPRVIIPTSGTSYLARDIRDNVPEDKQDFVKQKVGTNHRFNWQIIKEAKEPVFVVEGEIDAMSVYEAGYKQVVGLGSTSNIEAFLNYVEQEAEHKESLSFICALDNDAAGERGTKKFASLCEEHGFAAVTYGSDICIDGAKDANESLVKDREAFIGKVQITAALGAKDLQSMRYKKRLKDIYAATFIDEPKDGREIFLKWLAKGMAQQDKNYVQYAVEQAQAAKWTPQQMRLAITRYVPQSVFNNNCLNLVQDVQYSRQVAM